MSTTVYVKADDPTVAGLLEKTFGRATKDVAVSIHDAGGISLTSYWSGGTRDYHKVVKLDDMTVLTVPENGSGFTAVDRACGPSGLPLDLPAPGYAVVTFTDGCRTSWHIAIHRENAVKMLPAPMEFTWAENVALVSLYEFKAKDEYGKTRAQQSRRECGIEIADYDAAVASLVVRGIFSQNKAGALSLTTVGKNNRCRKSLWQLRDERQAMMAGVR